MNYKHAKTDPVVENALELLALNGFKDVTEEANAHKNSQPDTSINRQPDYYRVFEGPDQYGGGVHYCDFDFDVVELAQQYELVKPLSAHKVGDEVALPLGMTDRYGFYKIIAIKRDIITIETGARYRLNGSPVDRGEKYYRHASIQPITEDIRRIDRKHALATRLNAIDINQWKKMDLATLEAIAAILDQTKKQAEAQS